jgi:recombinational DNA repair protein (RecF pathway)
LPEIFDLTRSFLKHLCEHEPQPQNIFALELKLLHELGLAPDLEELRLTPDTKKIFQTLLEGDWATGARLKLSASQIGELRQFLHGFLIFHLGRLPHGRTTALAADI